MTTNKTLTTGINDALNRCRDGLEEANEIGEQLQAEMELIKRKRRILNKQMKERRGDWNILMAHRLLLNGIKTVLAYAVVTADKEAKQTPADGVVSICAPFPPRDPLGGTIVPATEVDPLGR